MGLGKTKRKLQATRRKRTIERERERAHRDLFRYSSLRSSALPNTDLPGAESAPRSRFTLSTTRAKKSKRSPKSQEAQERTTLTRSDLDSRLARFESSRRSPYASRNNAPNYQALRSIASDMSRSDPHLGEQVIRAGILNPRRYARLWEEIDHRVFSSPSRTAIAVFALVIIVFTLLLSLPFSSRNGQMVEFHHAFFTATSAVTVTGLTTVSTAAQWSPFGQGVILLACQIGGLGTLTMTSLLALAVGRKMGLRTKLMTQGELNIGRLGEVGSVLRVVAFSSITIEGAIALVLTPRFLFLGEDPLTSMWHGVFYSVSAFNNAGFTPHSDGIVPYGHDVLLLIPICLAVFLGSMGFPVILSMQQNPLKPARWSLTAKITLVTTTALLVLGAIAWGAAEWNNPRTIGDHSTGDKILHSVFASVMTRSGGFNLVDMNDIKPVTGLITDILMFIGGGSASTAGGIKVTTFAVILLAIAAEARGDQFVVAFNRTIPEATLRIAISVMAMSFGVIIVGAGALLVISEQPLSRVLFETISAYATCGLSDGLSAELPPAGIYVLTALMFIGRIGTITAATGLALRSRRRLYRFPEERPIIG